MRSLSLLVLGRPNTLSCCSNAFCTASFSSCNCSLPISSTSSGLPSSSLFSFSRFSEPSSECSILTGVVVRSVSLLLLFMPWLPIGGTVSLSRPASSFARSFSSLSCFRAWPNSATNFLIGAFSLCDGLRKCSSSNASSNSRIFFLS